MESVGRAVRFSSKLAIKVLEAALEGVIDGLLKVLGPEKARVLIDKDWYLVQSTFHSAYNIPIEVYQEQGLSPEEIQQSEHVRLSMATTVVRVLDLLW